ncbi:Peptidase family M23 [Rhizobium sp. RU35A]|uniref:M23 family metallopeptidase n=1 Tax=Rhizobium straminoryzae TaxID=1387186 RepID=A0A549TDD9_9HYPH|nr:MULTISPECIES: M23 family metallopeptidase [Rhizobium]TRL40073.1 M23 family metallopeptidase [Rhizobium straminoryzae]SIQ20777.1 Peptidase family M23 [Rhizobium sp. RU35A]
MTAMTSRALTKRNRDGFGFIHPAQTVIRFSFVSHWRVSCALVLLAVGASALLGECMAFSIAKAPVPKQSVVLRTARRKPQSTPKQARVWMPTVAAAAPKLDLIERMSDGSMAKSAYFDVSLDLSSDEQESKPAGSSTLAAYQEDEAPSSDPFNLVLRPGGSPDAPAPHVAKSARPLPVRGEPINVSVAPARPSGHIRRVVSLPAREELLRNIEGAVDVSESDFVNLARELGADSVKPGEELDILLEERPERPNAPQIVFARHVSHRKGERFLARLDNGTFQTVTDRHLYDRMLAEAIAAEGASGARGRLTPQESRDLNRAAGDYPKLIAHLKQSKVPPRVCLQVVQLMKTNGLEWSSSDDLPQLDVVYRKTEDNADELVSVTVNDGETERRFYRYSTSEDGHAEFYDNGGHSVSKTLMEKPVAAGRLGDGFGWRVHPILKVRKFHNGVDFAAPKGSPIVAAGDGVVEKISWEGGYGKFIRIRHDGGYETTYAHIDGTPKDLKVGQRVSQGQVIAYVGSTGLSTGPHLYYELRVGDHYADPTKAHMSAGTVLRGKALEEFNREKERVAAISDAIRTSASNAARAVAHVLKADDEPASHVE